VRDCSINPFYFLAKREENEKIATESPTPLLPKCAFPSRKFLQWGHAQKLKQEWRIKRKFAKCKNI
jgi:hypothetical protein